MRYERDLSLVGDSGGGALCATLSANSQSDPSLPIQRQALIYPSLDYSLSSPSVETLSKGYLLEKERIEWYFKHYLQNGENREKGVATFSTGVDEFPRHIGYNCRILPLER